MNYYSESYLEHHGIKGMRWGVRRFQNQDGSLTTAGQRRYGDGTATSRQNDSGDKSAQDKKQKLKKALAIGAGIAGAAAVGAIAYKTIRNRKKYMEEFAKFYNEAKDTRYGLLEASKYGGVSKYFNNSNLYKDVQNSINARDFSLDRAGMIARNRSFNMDRLKRDSLSPSKYDRMRAANFDEGLRELSNAPLYANNYRYNLNRNKYKRWRGINPRSMGHYR